MRFCVLMLLFTAVVAGAAVIESSVQTHLSKNEAANILVSFGSTALLLNSLPKTFLNRNSQLNTVTSVLKQNALGSQVKVTSFLEENQISFTSLWITNQISIKNANAALVQSIAGFLEVTHILEDQNLEILTIEKGTQTKDQSSNVTWGLEKIQVPEVWNLDGGNSGENVVVGTIDSGVRYTHEAIRDNFIGDYGWYDPFSGSLEPFDDNGHGTHTIGTIAGNNGIGVAPNSQWMSCRGCSDEDCSFSTLIACGQFIQCPTLANGSAPDCSRAPHVVSNSWGTHAQNDFFSPVIDSWVSAGIVPIFSSGNSGPDCWSIGAPAVHLLAIAVGNTDEEDALRDSSSRGPSPITRYIKPDFSAPGTNVYSAYNRADNDYAEFTGTSMAAPHVAGVAALLLSAAPDLLVAEIKYILQGGSVRSGLVMPGQNCGGFSEENWPNNAFGHGRISAYESFLLVNNFKK